MAFLIAVVVIRVRSRFRSKKDIPVVFLTGVSDKEHIEAVLELKPAGYLLKPANADRIYNIIEKVLG